MGNNGKIASNTIVLYMRMIIVMVINLIVVRLVLKTVGLDDYGLYNVIAGLVTSLQFICGVLTSATQRFYAFSIGVGEQEKVKSTFSISVKVYFALILVIVILCETIGLWYVNEKVVMDSSRIVAANWIFQFAVIAFCTSFISIPFSSLMISYEEMKAWAVISISEAVFKLLFIIMLHFLDCDKLIGYGFIMMLIPLISLTLYLVFCLRKHKDVCAINKYDNKGDLRKILTFSGWTMFGTLSGVCNNQGNTLLVNSFFGTAINGARGIASNFSGVLQTFGNNFLMAIRPPIVKCYAQKDFDSLTKLFNFGNKFLFYSMLLLCLPLFYEAGFVLTIWLGAESVNEYVIIFAKLSIIYSLLLLLQGPITQVVHATGNVKRYHLIVESFTLLSLPFSFLCFKAGMGPSSTYYVMIAVFSMAHLIRLIILHQLIPSISIKQYLTSFLFPAITVSAISYFILTIVDRYLDAGWIQFAIISLTSVLVVFALAYFIGLSNFDRIKIKELIKTKIRK